MRYYLTPVRIAIIKKSTNNKCWTASEEKGTLLCFGECKLVQSLWKTVWRFFNKLKRELPHDPAIQLLHIYPKQTKTLIWRDICIPMLLATWKPRHGNNLSAHQQMTGSGDVVHIYDAILCSIKNEILSFVAMRMDLENIMLSEISQTERQILHDFTYMWNLKKKHNSGGLNE